MSFDLIFVQPLPEGECLLLRTVMSFEAPIPVGSTDLAPLVSVFYKRLAAALEAWKLDMLGEKTLKALRDADLLKEDALHKLKAIQGLYEEGSEGWDDFKTHLKDQGIEGLELDDYSLVDSTSMEELTS